MATFYDLAEKALQLEREGKRIIRLNVGDTNLPTPKCAISAATQSIKTAKSGYGSSAGMQALRERIAEREDCDASNIVVGAGSKQLLYGILSVACGPGDRVAFPAPYWPAYELICAQLGLRMESVETGIEGNWEPGAPDLKGRKAALLCNPLNPTSTIYGQKTVDAWVEEAQDCGALPIIDEAYRGIAFEEVPTHQDAVRLRSFSKEFNMEGWRLGYAVVPDWLAKKLVAFNQISITCVPPFVQAAGMACLEDERRLLAANRRVWKSRSGAAQEALRAQGFSFAGPEAGIYVFATHRGIRDSAEYCERLLGMGVAVAPGSQFGGYRRFVRICVNRDESELEEAAAVMGEAARARPASGGARRRRRPAALRRKRRR